MGTEAEDLSWEALDTRLAGFHPECQYLCSNNTNNTFQDKTFKSIPEICVAANSLHYAALKDLRFVPSNHLFDLCVYVWCGVCVCIGGGGGNCICVCMCIFVCVFVCVCVCICVYRVNDGREGTDETAEVEH